MLSNYFSISQDLFPSQLGILVIIFIIWSMFWKGMALWKSARNSQKYWFLVLLVLNTIGIVEILYLSFFQKKPSPKSKSK